MASSDSLNYITFFHRFQSIISHRGVSRIFSFSHSLSYSLNFIAIMPKCAKIKKQRTAPHTKPPIKIKKEPISAVRAKIDSVYADNPNFTKINIPPSSIVRKAGARNVGDLRKKINNLMLDRFHYVYAYDNNKMNKGNFDNCDEIKFVDKLFELCDETINKGFVDGIENNYGIKGKLGFVLRYVIEIPGTRDQAHCAAAIIKQGRLKVFEPMYKKDKKLNESRNALCIEMANYHDIQFDPKIDVDNGSQMYGEFSCIYRAFCNLLL